MTKVLANVNPIRLEYCIINHFLMMFLITNWACLCNKKHPATCEDTVQTKYKEMVAPSDEIPKEEVDREVKPEL